jgi:4-hydroxy-tetrahydrodipicolinate synthase
MFTGSAVALITPMSADGSVDFDCLANLIEWQIEQGTAALVIAGTTGESATLDQPEHIDVIRRSAEVIAGRVPLIAGTGSNSTRQTIELSKSVGQFDVDGYLIVTPYYNKPTQEGLYRHFTAIVEAVSKPVMLYNVPGRTAVDLLPETVARLAEHPGIFGIKEATGEVGRVAALQNLCGGDFLLYSGDDATAREFILSGGQGVVSVTANVAPRLMADMCCAAESGQRDVAAELDGQLESLHQDLFIESNPIPVKWALERMQRAPGGIRLPLTRLAAEYEPRVEAALEKAGLV